MLKRMVFGVMLLLLLNGVSPLTAIRVVGLTSVNDVSLTPPPVESNKTYGGTDEEYVDDIVQTSDGGYLLVGSTKSFGAGHADVWLVKTDANGNPQWNKTYGGADSDGAICVVQTSDGGYAIAGWTLSFGAGGDFWLVKTDASGNTQWNKTYGGTQFDKAYSLTRTSDGGFALLGDTQPDSHDFWLVKTDAGGNMQWNKTFGGADTDYNARSIIQTTDGGYALTGATKSYGAGNFDFWLIKIAPEPATKPPPDITIPLLIFVTALLVATMVVTAVLLRMKKGSSTRLKSLPSPPPPPSKALFSLDNHFS